MRLYYAILVVIPLQHCVEASQQLRSLFQNGQVSRRICIEYLIESQTQHSAYHLFRSDRTDRHAEFFTDGSPYRRSRLHEYHFFRICNRIPDLVDRALFSDCAYRTGNETLTAVYAL